MLVEGNKNIWYWNGPDYIDAFVRDAGSAPKIIRSDTGQIFRLGETPEGLEAYVNDDAGIYFLIPNEIELLAYIHENNVTGEDMFNLQNRVTNGELIKLAPVPAIIDVLGNKIKIGNGNFINNVNTNFIFFEILPGILRLKFSESSSLVMPQFPEEAEGVLYNGYNYSVTKTATGYDVISNELNEYIAGAGQGYLFFKFIKEVPDYKELEQVNITENTTLNNTHHKKLLKIKANVIITIPAVLMAEFECVTRTSNFTAEYVYASGVGQDAQKGKKQDPYKMTTIYKDGASTVVVIEGETKV